MSDTKVICLGNQKGGCAKTSDCLNIAYCLANTKGYKVLLIDFDSQGSASLNVGIDVTNDETNTIDEILDDYLEGEISSFDWEDVQDFIYTPTYDGRVKNPETNKWESKRLPFGFDVIPASLPLSVVELKMTMKSASNPNRKVDSMYLHKIIETIKQNADYDYIIIDTPPALGTLSINAMAAATDGIIIPSNLDLMSFRGIKAFKESADFVQNMTISLGRKHRGILGILLSLYSERRIVDRALEEYVHEFYPTPTFSTQIRESSDAKKANASGMLFVQINEKAKEDFDKLVDEIELAINDEKKWKKQTDKIWKDIMKKRGEE